jgi:hypothetical protein
MEPLQPRMMKLMNFLFLCVDLLQEATRVSEDDVCVYYCRT